MKNFAIINGGQMNGYWSKNGIVFNKEIKIDQNEIERVLMQALAA